MTASTDHWSQCELDHSAGAPGLLPSLGESGPEPRLQAHQPCAHLLPLSSGTRWNSWRAF